MTQHRTAWLTSAITVALTASLSSIPAAQSAAQTGVAAKGIVGTVAPAALQALLPDLDGWTRTRMTADRIQSGEACAYAYAEGVYVNGAMKLRITVADTGFAPDGIAALATLVTAFPDGYTGTIPPDTSVQRLTYLTWPAATMWDTKGRGEFTVLVAGRFVAKVEAEPADTLDTLHAALDRIDLKQLAALK